jgi:putative mycofactocin binding protein MftB
LNGDTRTVTFERRWRLHPRVSLRPEPFGALAYHYDNRRLNFLRSHDLVDVVKRLEDYPTPREAFDAGQLDDRRWPSFAKALEALARSDFIEPFEPHSDTETSRPDSSAPVDQR